MPALLVNGKDRTVDADPDMPLLWVLRDLLGLTGTKYGCGTGTCGTCTVHLAGRPVKSCQFTLGQAAGKDVTTIEGLPETHPLFRTWAQFGVSGCGFCQPGQIMMAAALIRDHGELQDEQIVEAMSGNLCRCGLYARIVAAIRVASGAAR